MNTMKRNAQRLAAVIVLAVLSLAALVSPASAAIYDGAGRVGLSVVPQIDCRHKVFGGSSGLQMTAPPPTIWFADLRAGLGNDGGYVRYAVYYRDYYTGRVLAQTGWSGWAWATDKVPASFSGVSQYSADWRGRYVVDYRTEWWQAGGTAPIGWVIDRGTRYFYVAANNVAGGVWETCLKMY